MSLQLDGSLVDLKHTGLREIYIIDLPIMKCKKTQLATINNYATIHWSQKSKNKNEYKTLLKDWFLEDNCIPEDAVFEWRPIYKDARRRDSINCAPSIKYIEDAMVELGWMKDDNKTSHFIQRSQVDKDLKDHTLRLIIWASL